MKISISKSKVLGRCERIIPGAKIEVEEQQHK